MNINKVSIAGKMFTDADSALGDLEQEITLGQMLKSLRKCEGLKISELAERLGVNKQFLSAVENNKKQVGIEFIKQIASILDTPADTLLEIYFRDVLRKHGLNRCVVVKKAS